MEVRFTQSTRAAAAARSELMVMMVGDGGAADTREWDLELWTPVEGGGVVCWYVAVRAVGPWLLSSVSRVSARLVLQGSTRRYG